MADIMRRDVIPVDLSAGLYKDPALRVLAWEDKAPEAVGVIPMRGGSAVTDSITVKGYFTRADGVTVELTGTQDSTTHECTVTITDDCLAIKGAFVLAVQLRTSDTWRTVRMLEGVVQAGRTAQILETDEVIADLEALRADIAMAIIAPPGGLPDQYLKKTATGYAWGSPEAAYPSGLTIDGEQLDIQTDAEPDDTHITIIYED